MSGLRALVFMAMLAQMPVSHALDNGVGRLPGELADSSSHYYHSNQTLFAVMGYNSGFIRLLIN